MIKNNNVFTRKSAPQLMITVNNNYQTPSIKRSRSCLVELRMSSVDDYYKGMDAYQILEIPRNADKKTVKSAYRKGSGHHSF